MSVAEQAWSRGSLSPRQMEVVRRQLPHYARQLVERLLKPEWLEDEMKSEPAAAEVQPAPAVGGWGLL